MPPGHQQRPNFEQFRVWLETRTHVLHGALSSPRWRASLRWCYKLALALFNPWVVALLALVFYVTTILYAFYSGPVSFLPPIGGAENRPLRTLSALSIVTTHILLVSTFTASFDSLRCWLLVNGLNYLDYLVLLGLPTASGYLKLLFGPNRNRIKTKVWSILRILATYLPSLLNFLLTSDVQIIEIYTEINRNSRILGYGTGDFNATIAAIWQPAASLMVGAQFADFLADSHFVDLTSDSDKNGCTANWSETGGRPCRSSYYLPGGIESADAALMNSSDLSSSDYVLALNQRGTEVDFEDGDSQWEFDATSECSAYGFDQGGFAVCLGNEAQNVILARLTVCPPPIAVNSGCLNDKSWFTQPGWRTKLTVSHRPATVAYTWRDGKVWSSTFSNVTVDRAPVPASELLQAFNYIMRPISSSNDFGRAYTKMGLASNYTVLPFYIYSYFDEYGELAKASDSGQRRVMAAFQSLLAIPINYCQATTLYQVKGLGSHIPLPFLKSLFSKIKDIQPDTPIVLAKRSYAITVSLRGLIPFIVIEGIALLLCFAALMVTRYIPAGKPVMDRSSYPLIDHEISIQVTDGDGEEVTKENRQRLAPQSEEEIVLGVETWRATAM